MSALTVSTPIAARPQLSRSAEVCVDAEVTPHMLPPHAVSAAARGLAEAVALRLTGTAVRVACLLPSGRPVVLPLRGSSACSVSLAHTRRMLAAAACSADVNVGIDVVATANETETLDWCCRDNDESARIRAMPRVSVWAAKEAAYKASQLDAGFQPRRVRISPLDEPAFAWHIAAAFETISGIGRWIAIEGHVVAIAVRATNGRHLNPHDLRVHYRRRATCS